MNKKITDHLQNYYPHYLLFVLASIFFAPVLFTDQMYWYRDFSMFYYGDKKLFVDALQQGHFLLWNPYKYCGVPYMANIVMASFNPLNLLFLVLPFHLGLKMFLMAHVYLAGASMYWLLRLWKLEKIAALVGGIGFMFGGTYISNISNLPYLTSFTWIPTVFAVFHIAVTRHSWVWLLGSAMTLACQLFSGDPLTFLCTSVLLIPYFFIATGLPKNSKLWLRSAIWSGTLVGMVALLTAVQILPTWELMRESTRHTRIDYTEASSWSLSPVQLLQILCPALQGYPTERWYGWIGNTLRSIHFSATGTSIIDHPTAPDIPFFPSIFSGTVILVLCAAGLFLPVTRLKWFLYAVVTFFTLIAMGFYTPLFYWLWNYVPLVEKFRYPMKYFILAAFAMSALAAWNFSQLLGSAGQYRRRILIGSGILLLAYLLLYLLPGWVAKNPRLISIRLAADQVQIPVSFAPDALWRIVWHGGLAGLLVVILWWCITSNYCHAKKIWGMTAILFLAVPMIREGWHLSPTMPQKRYLETSWLGKTITDPLTRYHTVFSLFQVNEQERFVQDDQDLFLYSGFGTRTAALGYFQSSGYDAAILSRWQQLDTVGFPFRMLYFSSTRYMVFDEQLYQQYGMNYPILSRYDEYRVCENPNCLDRVWFPPCVAYVPDLSESMNQIQNPLFFENTAYIEGFPPSFQEYASSSQTSAKIIAYRPAEVIIEAQTQQARWLVLTDAFYPGWQCEVSGHATKIYPANILFRAVQIPAGKHQVRFFYKPVSFQIGWYISLMSWSAALAVIVLRRLSS
jgi:hypothetical protein